MIRILVAIARKLTGPFIFRKRLPGVFGSGRIYVTTRSDIRLLVPGWKSSAGDLVQVVDRYVKQGDVVWDIGSNLGILSFCSSLRSGKGGRVYSLEADTRYADIQSRTLKQFPEGAASVDVLCAAVADGIGLLELLIPKKGHARNHLTSVAGNRAGDAENYKPVVTITLDWLLERWKTPDFIKIDVEGAEVLAINGAERLFREARPIGYIECAKENRPVMTAFFKRMGYALFAIDDSGAERRVPEFVFNTIVKPEEKC
jgi:FkbM family methyltransferase